MSNVEWDSKLVIGSRAKANRPKAVASTSNSAINAARRAGAIVAVDRKGTPSNKAHQGPDHQRIAKLDRENEVAPPPKIAPDVGKAMQVARAAKELTQTKLAQLVNEPVRTIQDYEAGRATPNPQLLGKLERALGVKLRGAAIGTPLGGPKKAGTSSS